MSGSLNVYNIDQKIAINSMFRKRIVEEDALINQRMSWMIWSEALLLATWGGIFTKFYEPIKTNAHSANGTYMILWALPSFGVIIAIISIISIGAAQREITHLNTMCEQKFPSVEGDPLLPKLTGHKANHLLGHAVPYLVPLGFVLLMATLVNFSVHAL